MPRILLTQAIHPIAQTGLQKLGELIVAKDTSFATLLSCAVGCDVVIVRAQLPDDIFSTAPTLIGAVRHGAGVDMIPIDQATNAGVMVANIPGVNANAVAEHTVRSMLQLARRSEMVSRQLRGLTSANLTQQWNSARAVTNAGIELSGRTVGIIGFGNVGQSIAKICALGFGMKVLAFTRSDISSQSHAIRAALPQLLESSDYLVLACPLTTQTRGMIGKKELALLPKSSVLINVARGPVVDELALINALQTKQIAGAALDVFDNQPLPADHPFWSMENVSITPHVAGISEDSMLAMGNGVVEAVAQILNGKVPANCINPQATALFKQRFANTA